MTPLTPPNNPDRVEDPSPKNPTDLAWQTVTNRRKPIKQRKSLKPKREAVGKSSDTSFRGVKQMKRGILFITRCPPNTTEADFTSSIVNKVTDNFNLLSVESMSTKFNTYKSFKVTFDRNDQSLNSFFNDTVTPELWPQGIIVKPFLIRHHAQRGETHPKAL